jgi:hypothetical protein
MGNNTLQSRQKRPLWEFLILLGFFLAVTLLGRLPTEFRKHGLTAKLDGSKPAETQANRVGE